VQARAGVFVQAWADLGAAHLVRASQAAAEPSWQRRRQREEQEEQQQRAAALQAFERALELAPRAADVWANYGLALGTARRREALACFDVALVSATSSVPRAHVCTIVDGPCLGCGSIVGAGEIAAHVGCVLQTPPRRFPNGPSHGAAYASWGAMLGVEGRVAEAVAQHEHAVQAVPTSAAAHVRLAVALGKVLQQSVEC
jgi:tetratricopeptide (TPR) repeat protein